MLFAIPTDVRITNTLCMKEADLSPPLSDSHGIQRNDDGVAADVLGLLAKLLRCGSLARNLTGMMLRIEGELFQYKRTFQNGEVV